MGFPVARAIWVNDCSAGITNRLAEVKLGGPIRESCTVGKVGLSLWFSKDPKIQSGLLIVFDTLISSTVLEMVPDPIIHSDSISSSIPKLVSNDSLMAKFPST